MKKPDTSVLLMSACIVLIAALSIGLGFSIRDRMLTSPGSRLGALNEMAETIQKHFYFLDESTDETAIVDSALRGMMAGLNDPYAQYYTEQEYNSMLQVDAGDYVGIGISVANPDENGSTIIDVYANSPAEQAGVQKGDQIVEVNGKSIAGVPMDDFIALFSTDSAVPDKLKLKRDERVFEVTLQRSEVHVKRVVSEVLDGDVGYIRITEFNGSVVQDFWSAATALRSQGIMRLIIDLRDNPGGGLTEVLGVASYLIPKGQVIVTIKSRTESMRAYKSEGTERIEMETVVLVNGGSASASELLTGALQDYGYATIIGTRTYGKGIVQSYYRLNSNGGWMKLTTDAYYTPNDICIHGVGITPDITIALPDGIKDLPIELVDHEQDTQLQAALKQFHENASRAA
ncbi:MAG: S41 family peptidase [Clostridia bacterium]